MGRVRIALQSVVLLAMLAGLIAVAHDLFGWTPYWWSTETTVRKFDEKLASADQTVDIRRQFEALRIHDQRGIAIMVESLASPDQRIRESAWLTVNKQLDGWRLHNSPATHQLTMNLLSQLEQRTKTANDRFHQAAAELAQRLLQLSSEGQEELSRERAIACQRLLAAQRAMKEKSVHATTDQVRPPRPLATTGHFEDQFQLPGGLVPRN